jgi:hypothetical protein
MLKKIARAYSLCSFGYLAHSLLYFPNFLLVLEPSYLCISGFSLTFYLLYCYIVQKLNYKCILAGR